MVGARILAEAGGHFNPTSHHYSLHAEHTEHGFVDILKVGAKTHPQELLRIRNIAENKVMSGSQKDEFDASVQIFGMIQHSLKTRAEMPINYADVSKITNTQDRVVREIFESLGGKINGMDRDQYMSVMNKYYSEVNEHIHGFADSKYNKLFSNVLWTDDVPLAELESKDILDAFAEKSDSIVADKLKKAEGTPFSRQISQVGKARQSIFGITWLDHTVVFQNQLGTFLNTLSPDVKTAMEAMIESDKFIFMYNGRSVAATSLAANVSGFLEASKNRFWRIAKGFNFSSYMKKATSSNLSASFDVEDAHEFVDKIQAVRYAIHSEVPACAEAMEEIGGMSNWRSILTGRVRIEKLSDIPVIGKGLHDFVQSFSKEKSSVVRLWGGLWKGREKTLNAWSEWLNLYWPSGIRKYQSENALLLLGGSVGLFAVASAAGEGGGGEEEHH
jgi:hypothetical protein